MSLFVRPTEFQKVFYLQLLLKLWIMCKCKSNLVCCRAAQTATNCSVDNGGCDHECSESEDGLTRSCSCVTGYKLHDNSRKCVPKGQKTPDRWTDFSNRTHQIVSYTQKSSLETSGSFYSSSFNEEILQYWYKMLQQHLHSRVRVRFKYPWGYFYSYTVYFCCYQGVRRQNVVVQQIWKTWIAIK